MKRFLTHHIPSRAIAFLVMATMGTIVFHSRATAQQPLAYWSFEDSLGVADSSAGGNFPINYLVANIRRGNTDPIVGQYLTLDDSLSSPGQLQLDDSLWLYREAASFECWIRPGKEFSFGELIGWGRLTIRLEESRMIVRYLDERGFPGRHFHTIPLQGVGRSDPNYLRDGNWHHIAATVNVKTGLIKLFIDGISPPGFSKNIGNGMRIYNSSSVFQFNTNGQEFIGDLDEVAVYDQEIAPELVWQHYQNGLNGQHYDFVLQPGQVPQLEPVAEAALNPLEFPPGYPFTPDTSLHLLMHYPSARFRPQDTILPRNLPWINDLRSVSNSTNAPQVNPFATLNSQQAAQIAQYLAQEYNYYLWLGPSANYNNPSFTTSSSQLGTQLIPIANSLPEIPRFVITNWNQLNKSLLFPGFGGGPFVKSSFLTDTFYVRNANLSVNNKNYWAWPAVTDNYRADTLRLDGRVQADVYLDSLLGQLTVKRVDLVGENGEVLYPRTVTTLNADPYISADRGSMPWDQYQSLRAFQFRETFSDVFLDHLDSVQPPGNSRPGLYWYNVSGNQGVSRFRYDSMRTINSEIEGRRRASSYYYPQSPARWRFNGNNILPDFQHIIDGRPREIALGDSMYLPGVSPGLNDGVYNAPDERRIRPGQFLGILKGHAMLGADAFNLFMFNSINNRFQGNWVTWETVIPPFAQAITGRANEFWYDGELMPGNPNVTLSGTYSTNDFIYSTGNLNSFVLARREYNSSRLLIMGTHQRTSNQQSSGWKSADVCIDLLPELQFNTRLQGSTYILDTTAAPPVFYQLDSWHEWKDPSHWCPHFAFEAEVFDNAPDSVSIRTERPNGVATWDFREFTSFLEFQQAPSSAIAPTYSFSPRDPVDSLRIWVKARNFDASPRDIVFDLDSGSVTRSIVVDADTTWQWYHLNGSTAQVFDNVPVGRHSITLIPADTGLQIDKFVLLTAAGNMGDTLQLAISGDTVCVGDTARFNPTGLIPGGCMDYTWDFGDGTAAYDTTAWKVYQFPGTYNVSLIATENCSGLSDTSFATVIVSAPLVDAGPDTTVCFGATLDLQGVANWPYKWRPDPSLDTIVVLDPTVTPPSSQYYYLETYDPASGCSAYDSVLVTMLQQNLEYQDTFVICDSASAQLQVLGAFNILWSPGNTLDDSTAFDPVATPDSTTTYTFWSWDACNCDTIQGTITVVVVDSPQVVAMADTTICEDDTLTLTASGLAVYTWGGPNNFNVNTNVGTVQVPPFNVSGSTGSVQRTYVVRGTMCGVTTRDTIVVTVGNAPELDTAWIVPRFQRFHCPGTTVGFTVSNPSSATFSWEPAAYLNNASLLEPTIVAEEDTTYILTVTGTNGCATNYNFPVQYGRIFGPDTVSFCPGGYVDLTVSNTLYHEWLPTAMFPSPYANTARIYPDSSMWVYNAIADIGGACPHLDSVYLLELVPPQILTPDTILCYGDTLTLQATGANEYLWFPTIGLSDSLVQNPLLTATQTEIYRVMNCEVPYCFAHDSVVITVGNCCSAPGTENLFSPHSSTWTLPTSNDTFHIIDTFYVDSNISFSNCTFLMDSMSVILVESGFGLTLNQCTLQAACNYMWEGIILEDSTAEVVIVNNSLVRDGSVALRSWYGGELEVEGSTFRDNFISIRMDNYAGSHPARIADSRFVSDASTMLPPHDQDIARCGIWVDDIGNVVIGDSTMDPNHFDSLGIGIFGLRSNIHVVNNEFRAIVGNNAPPLDTTYLAQKSAVYLRGVKANPATQVHTLKVGGTQDSRNIFEGTPHGVEVNFNARLDCSHNYFDQIAENAIYIQDCHIDTCIVSDNQIVDAKFGVRAIFNSHGLVRIHDNSIVSDSSHAGMGINLVGISALRGPSPWDQGAYEVRDNEVDVYGVGIYARTVDDLTVDNNLVDIRGEYPYLDIACGILVAGIDSAVITDNQVTGYMPLTDTADGIRLEISALSRVKCNQITHFRSCLRFWGNSLGAVVKYNDFQDGWQGLVLENGGNIGQQGNTGQPTGNSWLPTSPDSSWVCGPLTTDRKMALAIGTNFSLLEGFYVRNTAVQNPDVPQDCNDFQGGGAIPFVNTTGTTAEDCAVSDGDGGGDSGIIQMIANKDIEYPTLEDESQYLASQTALSMMEINPGLYYEDDSLEAFYSELHNGNPGNILNAHGYLLGGELASAGDEIDFTAGNQIETNHQDVIAMLIDLENNDTLSTAALLALDSIARQCPLTGGKAVYQARSLMQRIDPTAEYDNDVCYHETSSKREDPDAKEAETLGHELKVWPNPAQDHLVIECKDAVEIHLFDLYGKELGNISHAGGQVTMSVREFSRGLILIRYRFENGEAGTTKIVLQ